jgi:hypothetical protein
MFGFLRKIFNSQTAKEQAVIVGSAVLVAGLLSANRKKEDPFVQYEKEKKEREESKKYDL